MSLHDLQCKYSSVGNAALLREYCSETFGNLNFGSLILLLQKVPTLHYCKYDHLSIYDKIQVINKGHINREVSGLSCSCVNQ